MKKLYILPIALSTSLIAPTAMAQFSGSGELGYSNNTGNTDNTALFAALKGQYEKDQLVLKTLVESSYKSENGNETEERYLLNLQADYYYDAEKRLYSFAGARFENNKFEDIDLDSTFSVGVGNKFIKTEKTDVTAEIGLGYQNTDFITKGIDSESQTVIIGKLMASHQLNEQVALLQDFAVTSGSERTKFESNTGVKVKVSDKANLKLSYKYRNNDNPPAGTKETDTQTLVTLTYDF